MRTSETRNPRSDGANRNDQLRTPSRASSASRRCVGVMVSATDRKAGARVISTAAATTGLLVVGLRPGVVADGAWALAGLSVFAVEEVEDVEGPATGEGETVRT